MSKKRISKTLLKNSEAQEELESRFLENEDLMQIIVTVLNEKLSDNLKAQRSLTAYGSPTWGYQQADYNGSQRVLAEVIDLLTFKE
jgi:hypothetical protein